MASSSKVVLARLAKRRLEAMLRCMSGKRVEIARAMEFALKRADAYDEVSYAAPGADHAGHPNHLPQPLRRRHAHPTQNRQVASRIGHPPQLCEGSGNAQLTPQSSSLPNVWRYRQSFEGRLPAVFEHFAIIHSRLLEYSGTMSANVFIQQVDAVLDIWESWWVEVVDGVLTSQDGPHS